MAPPPLNSYEYVFGDNGFILNSDDQSLPFLDVSSITGLDGAPLRTNTTEHEGADGTYVDAVQQSLRTVVITGTLYHNANDPDTICDLLCTEYGPGPIQSFYFQHPGKNLKFLNAQGGGCQYAVDTNRRTGQTPIQLTLLVGDPYKYDYPPQNAQTPGLTIGQPVVLNPNTGFEVNSAGWFSLGSSTLSQSSAFAYIGNGSLLVTPNGTTGSPGAVTSAFTVTPGCFYTVTTRVFNPTGWAAGATVGIRWFDINNAQIATPSATTGALIANTWTPITVAANAPSNAVTGKMVMWTNNTPAANNLTYWDESYFTQDVGFGFNLGFPFGFGPPQTLPAATVTNNGTRTAYPFFTLNGPLQNPVIRDATSNIQMLLTLTMAATDQLVVDCRNKSILLNGQSRRSSYQGLQWFSVPAGATDTFFFSASAGSGTLGVTLYNTYN